MSKRKYTRNKALYSNKKIWYVHIRIKEHLKTDEETIKEGKWIAIYVVDNSMARAIQKAVYYHGRQTGIKYLRMKKYYERDILHISCRRASKIEIVNARAGLGLKDNRDNEYLEVI